MIKIFRHIRKSLLMENKTSKYFKYALGEIFLVVVGILIALQINNWNENSKEKETEIIYLKNIKSELITNLIELETDYTRLNNHLEATRNVYDYIQTKPQLTDSMNKDFFDAVRISYFFPKTSNYETLKSGGLEKIRLDTLRGLITDIYESGYKRITQKVDTRRNAGRLLFPYYQKNFRTIISNQENPTDLNNFSSQISIPNDYEKLINDPEFETLIIEAIHGRLNIKTDFERTISISQNCISEIETYLVEND